MKRFCLITCLLSVLAFSSCSEFLEPKSSDEFVPENAQALNEMLVSNAYISAQLDNLFMFHNIFDDDVAITPLQVYFDDYGQASNDAYFALFTMQPNFLQKMEEANIGTNTLVWDSYYKLILGANAALDYVDKVNDLQENKDFVKAQALALRAFYYFHLVNLYSWPYNYDKTAPGVPLKLTSALATTFTDRGTVKKVYGQIVRDLKDAASLFHKLPEKRQFSKNYRISLPAVHLLLARVNLFMENWPEAIQYADSVLQNPNFELYDLLSFTPGTQPKPHYAAYSNAEVIWNFGFDLNRLNGVTKVQGKPDYMSTFNIFNASPELLATYDKNLTAAEVDLRKDLYMLDEYVYGYTGMKLKSGKIITDAMQQVPGTNTDYCMSLRLSEAYLILGEAYAMEGKNTEALRYLNALRDKRIENNQAVEGLSGEELIQFARDERRRELCFEGHRWFDLRRWGMESYTRRWKMNDDVYHNYVIEKNDPAFVLPIADEVIERDPGLQQNQLPPVREESR